MAEPKTADREVLVTLPEQVAALLGDVHDELPLHVREVVMVDLFRRREVSSGYAARVLGITRRDFLDLLTRYQVPYFNYTEEDLKQEFEAVEAELAARNK